MLFKLSQHRQEKLRKVFHFVSTKKNFFTDKMCPFFLNFSGKSALNLAIDAKDFGSFYILLE